MKDAAAVGRISIRMTSAGPRAHHWGQQRTIRRPGVIILYMFSFAMSRSAYFLALLIIICSLSFWKCTFFSVASRLWKCVQLICFTLPPVHINIVMLTPQADLSFFSLSQNRNFCAKIQLLLWSCEHCHQIWSEKKNWSEVKWKTENQCCVTSKLFDSSSRKNCSNRYRSCHRTCDMSGRPRRSSTFAHISRVIWSPNRKCWFTLESVVRT